MNTWKVAGLIALLWLMLPQQVLSDEMGLLLVMNNEAVGQSVTIGCEPQTRAKVIVVQSSQLPDSSAKSGAVELSIDDQESHNFHSLSTNLEGFSQSVILRDEQEWMFGQIIHQLAKGKNLKVRSTSSDRIIQFDLKLNGFRTTVAEFIQRCSMII
ncbi:hypothetical protein [uncultured Endozoicomonas sp.]|uniref:hypothetical protein n=1 Tax=uncultured Endozoicomonas sp. TaxID=432652 RepID=UPI00262DCFDE|nr:hypothetical protein [uncultured Endozoicomonas sp.]